MESKSVKLDISGMTPDQILVQGPQLLQEIQLVARSVQSNLFANPDFKRLVILHFDRRVKNNLIYETKVILIEN